MIVVFLIGLALIYILFDGVKMEDAIVLVAVAFVVGCIIYVMGNPSGYGYVQ